MKFWQLHAVVRSEDQAKIRSAAASRTEWNFIDDWLANFSDLVTTQDRTKLDYELPDDFVRVVLKGVKLRYYLGRDGYLRSRKRSFRDKRMSALEAFDRFGGEVIEDVLEKGCYKVL